MSKNAILIRKTETSNFVNTASNSSNVFVIYL